MMLRHYYIERKAIEVPLGKELWVMHLETQQFHGKAMFNAVI